MKKILFTLVLCIGLWSIPAAARPFDIPDRARAIREVGPALRIHHVDADWRSHAPLPSAVRVRIRSHVTRDRQVVVPVAEGPRLRLDAPDRLSVVAAIPEPSSTMLFGVGVLVALQAIPRKSSLVPSPFESRSRAALDTSESTSSTS
jgi:hypothetical protein